MTEVIVRPRADEKYDNYAHDSDNGNLIVSSDQGYENAADAEDQARAVYDDTRAKYADAVHAVPCVRCGPAGQPAPTDSPLSAGHQHARALRAIAKTILRDLWREAAAIHQTHHEAPIK